MAMTLLADNTADTTDLTSVAFTSGIDSTYKLYIFKFININPATNNTHFTFQIGSGYNTTMTTTFFNAYHAEAGGSGVLAYDAGHDQAQGTAYQTIGMQLGNLSDESGSGELNLFAPSSTTYVKHFYSRFQQQLHSEYSFDEFMAGYGDTTSAITQIDFKMSSGNFDGIIKMYGVG